MAAFTTRVPVYLPDRTTIGTAEVNVERGTAVIRIQSDSDLMELMSEDLVAFSVVLLRRDRVQEIQDNKGEKTDGTSS